MRIGYIYGRNDRALAKAGCDEVFVDDPRDDDRDALRAALIRLADAGGGVLVVVRRGDLGTGMRMKHIADHMARIGATLEVHGEAGEPPGRPGRASVFVPTDEQREKLRRWWAGDFIEQRIQKAVTGQVIAWAGWPDTPKMHQRARNWLNANIGRRSS